MVVFFLAQGAARLAVPFFFCCAGYFIAAKGIEDPKVVYSYLKKLIKSYLLWSLIYMPLVAIEMFLSGSFHRQGLLQYLQITLFKGSFVHLWYFPALILAVYMVHLVIKKLPLRLLIGIASLLYCFGLFGDAYFGLQSLLPSWCVQGLKSYQDIFLTTRNGVFFGFPFVLIGIVVSRSRHLLSKRICLLFLSVSLAAFFVEIYLLEAYHIAADYNMTVFLVPATIFLFLYLIQLSFTPEFDCRSLRAYSTLIYPSHLLFFGLVLAAPFVFDLPILHNKILQFVLVWGLSQLFAWLSIRKKCYDPTVS